MQTYTFTLTRKDDDGDPTDEMQFSLHTTKSFAKDIKGALSKIKNVEVTVTTVETKEVKLT